MRKDASEPVECAHGLRFCEGLLEPGSKVLDIGAGFGRDLLAFSEASHDPLGLEASEHRARYVREVLGIECLTSPVESAPLPDDLDLVFANHVLEHVTDPRELGRTFGRRDAAGRPLARRRSQLPAVRESSPVPALCAPPGFTPRSLTRLLNRFGFEVLRTDEGPNLRVLARKTARQDEWDGADANGGSRARTERAAGAWLRDGFGTRPGRRVILGWSSVESEQDIASYKGALLPGRAFRTSALEAARRTHRRLPAPLRAFSQRALPDYLHQKHLRMLEVEASGPASLPLVVVYERGGPRIWVK